MNRILSTCLAICIGATGFAVGDGGPTEPIRPSQSFVLDVDSMKEILSRAPMEGVRHTGLGDDVTIALPMPDGISQRFRVEESPMFSAEDSERFPGFRSYRVRGLDEPSWSGRLTQVNRGFGGLIRTDRGSVRISRSPTGGDTEYVSSFVEGGPIQCGVGAVVDGLRESPGEGSAGQTEGGPLCWSGEPNFSPPAQTVVRIYTAAVAARKDYTDHILGGGIGNVDGIRGINDDDVLAALAIEVSNLNFILEPELSIRLSPILSYALIYKSDMPVAQCGDISADCVDPGSETLNRLACVLQVLRDTTPFPDFELGHTLGHTPEGEICRSAASPGSVCLEDRKGKALTTHMFTEERLAHEVGHQLGAGHTFSYYNDAPGGCPESEYDQPSAFGPGSGSTLMSYAGCGGDEGVQDERDTYYHIHSIESMLEVIQDNCPQPACPMTEECADSPSGGQCQSDDTGEPMCVRASGDPVVCDIGKTIQTSNCDCNSVPGAGSWYCADSSDPPNRAPMIAGGGEFTIPPATPFSLSASANDPDNESRFAYNWDQYNRSCPSTSELSSALNDDPGPDPLFRSVYPASAAPLEALARKFSDDGVAGHILPDHPTADATGLPLPGEQEIRLRLVVRDGEGGIGTAETKVDVVGTEPFEVVVDPAPVGQLTHVRWNYEDSDATVEVSVAEKGSHLFTTLAGPLLANTGVADVSVPFPCGTDDHVMKVEVTQGGPLGQLATLTFDGETMFSVYCDCPAILDCGTCSEATTGGECMYSPLEFDQDGCFLESGELAFCPTGAWQIENCPCESGPSCPSENQNLYCACGTPLCAGECGTEDCSDHDYCTGTETCEITGCEDGTPPCPPGLCDPTGPPCLTCEQVGYYGYCNDDRFCNGLEDCNEIDGCLSGDPPCQGPNDPPCNDEVDECIETCPIAEMCNEPPSGPGCFPVDLHFDRCTDGIDVIECDPGDTIFLAKCPCEGTEITDSWYCAPPACPPGEMCGLPIGMCETGEDTGLTACVNDDDYYSCNPGETIHTQPCLCDGSTPGESFSCK